jgi:hypothetical protein
VIDDDNARPLHCGRCDEPITLGEAAVWDGGVDWFVHRECKYAAGCRGVATGNSAGNAGDLD